MGDIYKNIDISDIDISKVNIDITDISKVKYRYYYISIFFIYYYISIFFDIRVSYRPEIEKRRTR
jgi:hypothetical protein